MNIRTIIDESRIPLRSSPDFCSWGNTCCSTAQGAGAVLHTNVHAKWDRWGDLNDVRRRRASRSTARHVRAEMSRDL